MMKQLTVTQVALLNDILDYLEDSEIFDFEDSCNEMGLSPSDILYRDIGKLENHIFYKVIKLRESLSEEKI